MVNIVLSDEKASSMSCVLAICLVSYYFSSFMHNAFIDILKGQERQCLKIVRILFF